LEVAEKLGAKSFDAKGADYFHREIPEGEVCTFITLMMEHGLWGKDPALDLVAKIVSTADVHPDRSAYHEPEAEGLSAIAHGFALLTEDDHKKIGWETPMYDALVRVGQEEPPADGEGFPGGPEAVPGPVCGRLLGPHQLQHGLDPGPPPVRGGPGG